jgi:hypothetical protein
MYKRHCIGVQDKGNLVKAEEVKNYINPFDDNYESLYLYNEEQKKLFDTSKSVSGIEDVIADNILFDFDKDGDLEQAISDACVLVGRLMDSGVSENAIGAYFSGNKGVHVQVKTNDLLSVQQFKDITYGLAGDLPTFDRVVNNPSRIIRIENTKHKKSGLYKVRLDLSELQHLDSNAIKDLALKPRDGLPALTRVTLPESLYKLRQVEKKPELKVVSPDSDLTNLDFANKPKGWSNCKFALLDGYGIKEGDRHAKLLAIVATAKALNELEGNAYYKAKHAMKRGVERYGGNECSKDDLESIVKSVYSVSWKGGSYSCRDGKSPWLTEICNSLGRHKCQAIDSPIVTTNEVFGLFQNYAENFEKNVLQTGIATLDEKCKFMVGTSNGILAPPGVGKSTLSFGMINHNSNLGNHSIFFSYDMFHSMVFLRLVQRHFGLKQEEIFDIFKHDKKKSMEIKNKLDEEYKNVHFCFKSGQTADEIYETILETEQKIGDKVKLVMVDYNELVISNVSDPTQASAQTAQRLRQIANDTATSVITLLQPSKIFSNPADEISTYQGAKGSGAIAQSLSLMISLSRPGFSPRHPEMDKFFTVNALKNRQGPLFTVDLGWNGLSGQIRDLTEEENTELAALREQKALEKSSGSSFP